MMPDRNNLLQRIFQIQSDEERAELALEVFRFQYNCNTTYQDYCRALKVSVDSVKNWQEIPFLPISFFKTHRIVSGSFEPAETFSSSGTTGETTSRHFVRDLDIYERSFFQAFQQFYGAPEDLCLIALLPAYLERKGSSLVYMAHRLIEKSKHPKSGFFLHQLDELGDILLRNERSGQPTLLLGVTFALLDLADVFQHPLQHTIIMETGGMKGRRTEITRDEVHHVLKRAFKQESIHSEYGMTELLSQAYSKGEGIFECPAWMQVNCRDTTDPLSLIGHEKTGGINVMDLANIDSCAFIATQDLGKTLSMRSFTVAGRFDHADVRGCNLLVL